MEKVEITEFGGVTGQVVARAMGVTSIHVSLTHQPGTAAAVVLLEG